MADEEAGFTVTLRDVFDEVKALSGSLSAYVRTQEPRMAVIEHRVTEVEGDLKDLHDEQTEAARHRDEERRHRALVRWGVIGAAFAGLCGFVGSAIAVFAH